MTTPKISEAAREAYERIYALKDPGIHGETAIIQAAIDSERLAAVREFCEAVDKRRKSLHNDEWSAYRIERKERGL